MKTLKFLAGEDPRRERTLVAAAATLATLALYVKTLCTNVFWQDSGLYTRSVSLLGSGVPPGFPGYHLAAYLFTMLPGLGPVVGLNFFSAVAGALSALFIVYLFYEVAEENAWRAPGAAVAALLYGAAPTIWIQATTCEVYTLNLALTAATMWALFVWRRGSGPAYLYLASFLYGLGCTNHPQQAVMLLPYGAFIAMNARRAGLKLGHVAPAVALWLLAMSVYLYLPVRSAAGIACDWGKPRTLYGLVFHITAKEFQGQMFSSPSGVIWQRLREAGSLLVDQYTWVGLAVAAGGFLLWARKRGKDLVYFALMTVATLFLTVNYNSFGFRAWYFVFYMLIALAAGAAVTWAVARLAARRALFGWLAAGAALAAACSPIAARFYRADRTYYPYALDYSANEMRALSYQAFFFLGEENSSGTGGVQTLITVDYARPDVTYVDTTGNANFKDLFDYGGRDLSHAPAAAVSEAFYEILSDLLANPQYDYYFLSDFSYIRAMGYGFVPVGLLWRVYRPGDDKVAPDVWLRHRARGLPPQVYLDYWGADMAATYYYNLSAYMQGRDERKAARYLALAADAGARSAPIQHNVGGYYFVRKEYARAIPYFRRSLELNPTVSLTRYLLAESYSLLGREGDARRELQILQGFEPDYPPAKIALSTGKYVAW
jgi:TPR repeat protein